MFNIRYMIRRDMPEVLGIEDECFAYPWSEQDLVRCLRQRSCIGIVAENSDVVQGFMIYELHKHKIVILNLAVGWKWQRQGIGAAMISTLRAKLSQHRRVLLEILVRETNLDACLFFRAMGFAARQIVHEPYDGTDEDAYLFDWRLPVAEGVAVC